MPVKSLNSSVLRWPDADQVDAATRKWGAQQGSQRPELVRCGYFGSYARRQNGVGSDLDLVAIVKSSAQPFSLRPLDWDLKPLPVPAEILVYTVDEWHKMLEQGGRFADVLKAETVWVYHAHPDESSRDSP